MSVPSPGAERGAPTTAIVFGPVRPEAGATLANYGRVLWVIEAAGTMVAGTSIPPLPADRVEVVMPPNASGAGAGLAAFRAKVETFFRHDPRRLPALHVSPEASGSPDYGAAIQETRRLLEVHRTARFTRQQDGFTWQRHLLANAPTALGLGLPAEWQGKLRGMPAAIVGAGPSFSVSAAALQAAAPGVVVFSADSSLRALARLGVPADFAVSIDIAKEPSKCLPADGPLPGKVALAYVSPPAWLAAIPKECLVYLSGRQVTEDWLAKLGAPRAPVGAVENCGATALELAVWLGCSPIYLFGLDLALADENPAQRHHAEAEASIYRNSHFNARANHPRVPGNYAATVPTFALRDWQALDERLAARATPPVINVNDRGARFRGTTLVHPSAFVAPPPRADKAALLAALQPASPSAAVAPVLTRLDSVRQRAAVLLPTLRETLASRGPEALADVLRRAIVDPELANFLGSYAFKLMPHLKPPIEEPEPFWRQQLDEWEELTRSASVYE